MNKAVKQYTFPPLLDRRGKEYYGVNEIDLRAKTDAYRKVRGRETLTRNGVARGQPGNRRRRYPYLGKRPALEVLHTYVAPPDILGVYLRRSPDICRLPARAFL